jgi:acyl carrier protein
MSSPQAILQQLTPIFRKVFEDDELVPTLDMTAEDVELWDSMRHVRMVLSVEKVLGVRFTTDEIAGLENVGALVLLAQKKLGAPVPA